jgi:hypothetical protein
MILWEGASQIDGKRIVAIATIGSKNPKTGDMVQVWILRCDTPPHEAVKNGADASVCGDCKQRRYLGGACYVQPHQAPLSVWKRYAAGGYSDPKWCADVQRALQTLPIRMGAYGDPAAVPFHVWEALLAEGCGRFTGYTHQWRRPEVQDYRKALMASCDTEAEAEAARSLGWRFFLVTAGAACASSDVGPTVECLSESRGMSCAACGICDGTRADSRSNNAASVVIQVHGPVRKRFLAVVQ